MITVDKNVPIPPRNLTKYPWDTMCVGDSFVMGSAESHLNLRSQISKRNKKHPGKSFIARRVENIIRVWRIR